MKITHSRLIGGMVWTIGASPTFDDSSLTSYCDYSTYVMAYGEVLFRNKYEQKKRFLTLFNPVFLISNVPVFFKQFRHELRDFRFLLYFVYCLISVSFALLLLSTVLGCCCVCIIAAVMAIFAK